LLLLKKGAWPSLISLNFVGSLAIKINVVFLYSFFGFREFFYIQMEKYARQAIAEGVKSVSELVVTVESELYRILVLHYNRNNQIEVRISYLLLEIICLIFFILTLSLREDVID